jgi:hippurate hydrolase
MIDLLGGNSVFSSDDFGKESSKKGGSEDFSYISREVPSLMLAIAAGNSEEGYAYAQHHPKVMFDESVLTIGSAVYAYSAFRWLQDNK